MLQAEAGVLRGLYGVDPDHPSDMKHQCAAFYKTKAPGSEGLQEQTILRTRNELHYTNNSNYSTRFWGVTRTALAPTVVGPTKPFCCSAWLQRALLFGLKPRSPEDSQPPRSTA